MCSTFEKWGFYNKHDQSQQLHVAIIKRFKELISFSWVNVILKKAIYFMVCTSVQKNTSVCTFCQSALLKWVTSESLASRVKVWVCLHGGYSLCRDKLTFMSVDSYETQASRIQGLWKPYNYCLQDWVEKILFFFFGICLLLALSVIQLALRPGRRVILARFFLSDVWCHQRKSLCCSRVGGSYALHVDTSMDGPGWIADGLQDGLQKQYCVEGSRNLCQECFKVLSCYQI